MGDWVGGVCVGGGVSECECVGGWVGGWVGVCGCVSECVGAGV